MHIKILKNELRENTWHKKNFEFEELKEEINLIKEGLVVVLKVEWFDMCAVQGELKNTVKEMKVYRLGIVEKLKKFERAVKFLEMQYIGTSTIWWECNLVHLIKFL